MKKIISIVLAVTMIFGIFSCNAFAADTLTEVALEKLKNSDEYHMIVEANVNNYESEMEIYVKGDKISMEAILPIYEGIDLPVRFVINKGTIKVYFPNFPLFCFELDPDEVMYEINMIEALDISSLDLTKSYEETIHGKTYTIEEFSDEDGNTYRYTMFNGDIVKTEATMQDDEYGYTITNVEIDTKVNIFAFFTPLISIKVNDLFGDDIIMFD